jgi:hypothetical protein
VQDPLLRVTRAIQVILYQELHVISVLRELTLMEPHVNLVQQAVQLARVPRIIVKVVMLAVTTLCRDPRVLNVLPVSIPLEGHV